MKRKRFRAGTVVKWRYGSRYVYGVINRLKRTRYSVRSLVGDSCSRNWAVHPRHLTRVSGVKREEVLAAQAALALTGKAVTRGKH